MLSILEVQDIMKRVIITVAHEAFKQLKLSDLARMQNTNPILVDVRGIYDRIEAKQAGFTYRTL